MANAEVSELIAPPPAAKVSLGSLLLVALIAVVLAVAGCAGTLLWLSKSGKLGAASASQPQVIAKEVAAEAAPLKNVALEPLLVNLADEDGHAYLRLGVVLGEEIDKDKKPEKEEKPAPGADAAVRDAILGVLGKKHAAELLDADGKDALKKELQTAVSAAVPAAKVKAVYFTDFLVQR